MKPGRHSESSPDRTLVASPSIDRRTFLQVVGSGILITVTNTSAVAQPGRGRAAPGSVAARLYLNEDGTFTALSGKVEEGQGPRAELSQAAAEELRVTVEQIRLIMADTDLVPDDGITAGSRTTPINVPEMRQAAATARELLVQLAAGRWNVPASGLEVRNGVISDPSGERTLNYADLASAGDVLEVLSARVRTDLTLTSPEDFSVLGRSIPRPNARDLVTGTHLFPSDIVRPNMLYGRILRPPAYGAGLKSVDLSPAEAMDGVRVVRDGSFVGVAAPTSFHARKAVEAIAETSEWETVEHPANHRNLARYLAEHARRREARPREQGSVDEALRMAVKQLEATYSLAYIQHAPMEPRAAVAEWDGDRLTVWAGCDAPFRARRQLAEQFGVPEEQVRVIIPDMGGGFGGKHTAEPALEAARIARAVGRPVWVRWTREEEFTWAYSRPAAVVECKAGLDQNNSIVAWDFANINGGGAAIGTPYAIPNTRITSIPTDAPLPQGSYRVLGATGSNFGRESFMDELAAAGGADPVEFRLAHLDDPRMKTVLETAADRFGWAERKKKISPELGIGVACGTEKNSYVAACVEVAIDQNRGEIRVVEVCEAFECGPILNPANLTAQVQGCICMGLGGALTEEQEFENGRLLNPKFSQYQVPRFRDIPKIEVHLVPKNDIPSAGGGETPIIAIAPAIGNAVFAATGVRLRAMPMRGESLRQA